jgi:stringent starvation protein B
VTSSRPYLIRAIYDWLVDNGLTPHLLVDAAVPGVAVPAAYVKDGQIVLNISPSAVRNLELGNDLVRFEARFGGQPVVIWVPPTAVRGIYARENGQGMVFPDEPRVDGTAGESPPERDPEPPSAPPR